MSSQELTPAKGGQTALQQALAKRVDFNAFAHDVSNSVLFALERRHLDYLDLRRMPYPQKAQQPGPGELFFLKLAQIGHGAEMERSLDLLNMENILGTFRDGSHSLVTALCADGAYSHLYMGARRLNTPAGNSPVAYDFVQNLRRTIEGNLPGTRFHSFPQHTMEDVCPPEEVRGRIMDPIQNYPYLAALTGIPSLRAERDEQFAQSLDRLIQGLQGQRYQLLIIAEPVGEPQVNDILTDCLRLNTEVHSWVRIGMSYAQAIGDAVADGKSKGTVRNQSEAEALAKTKSKAVSKQPGSIVGGVIGAGVALALSPVLGLGSIAVGGMAMSSISSGAMGMFGSNSDSIGENETTTRSRTWGETLTDTLTTTSSRTETTTMNVEHMNKTAEYCERVIEGYVGRLQRAKNLGMWNVGVYFLAEDPATFAQGRAQLRALYSGRESYYEPMRTLDLSARLTRPNMGAMLATFSNPVLDLRDAQNGNEELHHPLGKMHRSLSTPLTTDELALLLNLPRREVSGLKLQMVADFGLNPNQIDPKRSIVLGKVVSGGRELDIPIGLEPDDLTRHVFVTGITGGGKTNTCFALLKEVNKRNVPFLVIEPAKGEYRRLLDDAASGQKDGIPGLRIYTIGDETVSPFRINPFQFVPGMNLITHLDNLKAIFNASFPMYAAMPYLLEEAIVRVYEDRGWDLVTSQNSKLDMDAITANWKNGIPDYRYAIHLPTLGDLMTKIDEVVTSKGYAEDVMKNYAAALKARISSLLLGSKGRMLNTQRGIPYEDLFGNPTVLELRSLGDDDEKCFMMALLLTQLYEYREQQHRWNPGRGLRHLTVLEESHRLLGQAGPSGSMETANPRGKAVEAFANMLAEIREYGEGFLIVDQTPAKLIPDVVKNTSAKILHRLTARDDREVMGDAMSMNDQQKMMPPRLRVGDAILHTQDQDKPIWVKITPVKAGRQPATDIQIREVMAEVRKQHAETEVREAMQCADELGVVVQRLTNKLADKIKKRRERAG